MGIGEEVLAVPKRTRGEVGSNGVRAQGEECRKEAEDIHVSVSHTARVLIKLNILRLLNNQPQKKKPEPAANGSEPSQSQQKKKKRKKGKKTAGQEET